MKKLFILFAFSSLIFSSDAGAQFRWKVVHPDHDADNHYRYIFDCLSCSDENCTVAGLRQDTSAFHDIELMFWRTTNGGITWNIQDPFLQFEDGQNANQFSSIQQIDSLNVVAIGDGGIIMRTFDGGKTWQQQDCHTLAALKSVHFSDTLTGIITTADSVKNVLTTIDGGRHWNTVPFGAIGLVQCHSYGGGKYRLLKQYYGPIYTTTNNWKTIDSTKIFIDSSDPYHYLYIFYSCNFSGGDTILVYGAYYYQGSYPGDGLIMRSTNGGVSWEDPIHLPFHHKITQINTTTSIDRDIILAGGDGLSEVLRSTDRGFSWNFDTIRYVDSTYMSESCKGIAWSSPDHPIAIYSFAPFKGMLGVILRGEMIKSKVEAFEYFVSNTYLFPNPAYRDLNIFSIDVSRPIHVFDMLGREVYRGLLSDQGKITIDISKLPRGIYNVLLDHTGKMLPIGKVAVVGK